MSGTFNSRSGPPVLIGFAMAVVLWMTVQTVQSVARANPQESPSQRTDLSAKGQRVYFPRGTDDDYADFYSAFLKSIGEPSLLAAAQDTSVVSYRLICMFCQRPCLLVVRVDLKLDGSAAITTTLSAVDSAGVVKAGDRTNRTVSAKEVDRFLGSIERANFWTMPSNEQLDPSVLRFDLAASRWVFEGARGGAYHVVFRQGPELSAFTEMVRLLAKDMAKLDNPAVPHAFPAQKNGVSRPRTNPK